MDCNCFKRPFEPPKGCLSKCVGKFIKYAKPNELIQYFNFEEELAEELFEISSNDDLQSLEDFLSELPENFDHDLVITNFQNISEEGWEWIRSTLKNRIESEQFVIA